MVLPFGSTLHLWRLHRRLTQQELARRAGIPRPNLSAIERGRQEVSLSTLRALAVALEVRPGRLVDGEPPAATAGPRVFSREALERVADAVVRATPLRSPAEREAASLLRELVRHRLVARPSRRERFPRGRRRAETAWVRLRSWCPPAVLHSLLQRIEDRLRLHDPASD